MKPQKQEIASQGMILLSDEITAKNRQMDPHSILQNAKLCTAQKGWGEKLQKGLNFFKLLDEGLIFRIYKELKNANKKYRLSIVWQINWTPL